MSVLIKNMEMPKVCAECFMEPPCMKAFDPFKVDIWKERHPDCPLVEVEPHGKLIDATFEENHYASVLLNPTPDVTEQDKHKAKIIIEALRMARTVIEAEGGKE